MIDEIFEGVTPNSIADSFARSHRAPRKPPRISLVAVLMLFGVILLITAGVMISVDLGIL